MTNVEPRSYRSGWRRRLRWAAGRPGRAVQRRLGYWLRRLRHGCGVGYRDGRVLRNGVRLMDCDGSTDTEWVCTPFWLCDACGQTGCWDYGYRGDPRAEALTLASAWLHESDVSNPAPIVAILGRPQPAVFCWARAGDGVHLVPVEADPSALQIKVTG